MSDETVLAIGAALLLVVLAGLMWRDRGRDRTRRRPRETAAPPPETCVVVDGSNVMHWGGEASELVLIRVIRAVEARGLTPIVIFDANVGWVLYDKFQGAFAMARRVNLPPRQVHVVDKGVVADAEILELARREGLKIVSNDRFRDWSVRYPLVKAKGRTLRGTWSDGTVRWAK
ncbi:hypothetical protein [Salipiger sp. IMCC34102]|uniref:NYN domain-containing protein n=1 Tax=Salipiger sp. IMCC34102 TaxID=2510647 RepID=UPI0013EA34D6|nr:hypothetical protein [Salipiger sp. IMCC34102]